MPAHTLIGNKLYRRAVSKNYVPKVLNMKMCQNQKNRCKTKKQMAEEFGVCTKTFRQMLERNEIVIARRLITPKEQIQIYRKLGKPKA